MAGRKKLNRVNLHARVEQGTGDKLKEIAHKLGYIYPTTMAAYPLNICFNTQIVYIVIVLVPFS